MRRGLIGARPSRSSPMHRASSAVWEPRIDAPQSGRLDRPMRRRQPRTGRGRAIIGLVALYALLLQAFLGLATPSRALDGPGEVLCAGHSSGEPASKGVHVHACCTVVQAGTLTLPPIDPEAAAWPSAPTSLCAWRPEAEIPTTGPPAYNGTARGPPAA